MSDLMRQILTTAIEFRRRKTGLRLSPDTWPSDLPDPGEPAEYIDAVLCTDAISRHLKHMEMCEFNRIGIPFPHHIVRSQWPKASALAYRRLDAKASGRFDEADKLRDELKAMGVEILDRVAA